MKLEAQQDRKSGAVSCYKGVSNHRDRPPYLSHYLLRVAIVVFLFCCSETSGLVPLSYSTTRMVSSIPFSSRVDMVGGSGGGSGWDNKDYLSSLSGDDDDLQQQNEAYQDYSERRQAFQQRQQEYMAKNEEKAKAFLQQRQEQQRQSFMNDDSAFQLGEDDLEEVQEFEALSGGGTRMSRMMAQAKKMKQFGGRDPMMLDGQGFVPKFAVPFDEEDENDNSEKDEE